MCTRYPIINRVSELKVHIELTRFVQPEKIEIDANERAVNEKSQYCFFVCTTFDSFLNDFSISPQTEIYRSSASLKYPRPLWIFAPALSIAPAIIIAATIIAVAIIILPIRC